MTQRLSTTLATASVEFDPTGETILQLDSADRKAKVEVLARVDADAQWVGIGELSVPLNRFIRLPLFPKLKLVATGNTAGQTLTVRSN